MPEQQKPENNPEQHKPEDHLERLLTPRDLEKPWFMTFFKSVKEAINPLNCHRSKSLRSRCR